MFSQLPLRLLQFRQPSLPTRLVFDFQAAFARLERMLPWRRSRGKISWSTCLDLSRGSGMYFGFSFPSIIILPLSLPFRGGRAWENCFICSGLPSDRHITIDRFNAMIIVVVAENLLKNLGKKNHFVWMIIPLLAIKPLLSSFISCSCWCFQPLQAKVFTFALSFSLRRIYTFRDFAPFREIFQVISAINNTTPYFRNRTCSLKSQSPISSACPCF